MNRQEYMEILSGQIRCRQAVPLVIKELEVHIEEQKADFLAEGMPESEAEEMAEVEAAPRIRLRRRLRIRLLSLLSRQLRNRSCRNSRSSRNIRQSYRIPIIRTARTRLPSWSMVCRRLTLNIGIRSLRNTCTFWRIRFLWHTGCPTRGRIHRDCYGLRCAESPWLV